jgi:hemerythrin
MAVPGWDEGLVTGYDAIDADHKGLFACITELEAAVLEQKGRDVARPVLQRLIDYARSHFAREEGILAELVDADRLRKHKEQHLVFIRRIDVYVDLLATGGDCSGDMCAFLSGWLVHHIMTVDKQALRQQS